MKKKIFSRPRLLFFFFIFLILAVIYKQQLPCRELSCLYFKGIKNLNKKEIYQNDKNSFRGLYFGNRKIFLKVEAVYKISSNDAQKYIDSRVSLVNGFSADAPAPYPGRISDKISCDKKYQPIFKQKNIKNGLKLSYFEGYFNNRLTFGVCNPDEVVYQGFSAFFYCPRKKQAYTLSMMAPKDKASSLIDIDEITSSLRCY